MSDIIYFYILLAFLSYLTPGPDWAVICKGTFQCKKTGMLTALGVQSGLFFHLILGSLGATLILTTSQTAFNVLQAVGALYLLYLGYSGLKEVRRSHHYLVSESNKAIVSKKKHRPYITGLLANVFNPKAAIFFISILPQFINPAFPAFNQVIVLGVIDILIGIIWWVFFVHGLHYIQSIFFSKKTQIIVESITSLSLLIFGGVMLISIISSKISY